MSGFLLDTNVISEFKRRRAPDLHVQKWLRSVDTNLLWTSVLVIGEIRKGIERLPVSKRRADLEIWVDYDLYEWFEDRLLPINKAIAERWGVLSARCLDNGTPLTIIDGLLAATAIKHNLVVVTRNEKDFANAGVPMLNPWETVAKSIAHAPYRPNVFAKYSTITFT